MNPNEPGVWERGADPGNGSVPALEALQGLPLAGGQRLSSVRLSAVVGATLRAAVDLLLDDPPSRRPIQATFDDGALDLVLPEIVRSSLTAAAALLETIDGSLGASREGRAFMLRVPVAAPRALYLMLEQGTLGIAVPWHTVVRIRLAKREDLESLARREGCPVLPPFVSVPSPAGERPAILVALGLRRAYLVADRLVWRMPADPAESEAGASGASLGPAVRTSDGEIFRVADPSRLLAGIEPAPLPAPASRRSSPPVAPGPAKPPSAPIAPPRIVELRREDVEPLGDVAAPAPPPAPVPSPAPRVADPPRAPQAPKSGRRALVVEDSIVGRIFLQRLLEAAGYSVESASSSSELRHALGVHRWDLLFVDVSLPDSPRGMHLQGLSPMTTVALVRDARDESAATGAGIRHALRKPFERGDLLRLLENLRLGEEAS